MPNRARFGAEAIEAPCGAAGHGRQLAPARGQCGNRLRRIGLARKFRGKTRRHDQMIDKVEQLVESRSGRTFEIRDNEPARLMRDLHRT